MIKLKKINKVFEDGINEVEAIKDVSIDIAKGEIYGIIGLSGAGKSTLVRCINLLETPTKGDVYVDGVNLKDLNKKELREQRTKIGMIFQHFNLLPSRTVYSNVAYALKKSNLSKDEKDKKIKALLKLVDLEDKVDAYPSQLSGGQKQRVAIARAIANDPKVLLCDEATSALDPKTTKSILRLLGKINNELGITIVIITHEMEVVKEICHKVAVMENGIVVEEGSVLTVFHSPKEETTKEFISTTSNIDTEKIYKFLEINDQLCNESYVYSLTYKSTNVGEAVITDLVKKFDVETNIVFGNIEFIQNVPVGKLVVIFKGEKSQIEKAITYIKDKNVEVEEIVYEHTV
ncbi:MAG: methionine ABC transporter ATP-binding protein [Lachnospirales bacterium]